jgi:hypothetical protein
MTLHTGVGQPLLHKGERTEGVITLQAEGIPAEAWQGRVGADPELVDLAAIRKSAPGFEPPREGQPGTILLAIQNQSPETISIAGFKGTTQVYSLSRHSLPFNTRLGIHATRAGSFNINVIAQPFLAPARFQEFRRGSTFSSRP